MDDARYAECVYNMKEHNLSTGACSQLGEGMTSAQLKCATAITSAGAAAINGFLRAGTGDSDDLGKVLTVIGTGSAFNSCF